MDCSYCRLFQFLVINLLNVFPSFNTELRGCFNILLSEDRALRDEGNE